MNKLMFSSSILFIALLCSCEQHKITEYACVNYTNDSITVIVMDKGLITLSSGEPYSVYIEGLGNDGRLNPFDAETHIVYKGKEYAENSLTGNSIRNKDAYEAHTEYKVTSYYFHITEEYILSLPEVPLTE